VGSSVGSIRLADIAWVADPAGHRHGGASAPSVADSDAGNVAPADLALRLREHPGRARLDG
jgi:hypothetical protein